MKPIFGALASLGPFLQRLDHFACFSWRQSKFWTQNRSNSPYSFVFFWCIFLLSRFDKKIHQNHTFFTIFYIFLHLFAIGASGAPRPLGCFQVIWVVQETTRLITKWYQRVRAFPLPLWWLREVTGAQKYQSLKIKTANIMTFIKFKILS